jgi:ubiquinone/menaquinone biosynthesis C-methylase UbiE
MLERNVDVVRDYWDGHTLGNQYVRDTRLVPGSPEFFAHIRPWMNPFKFPDVMPRIERNAPALKGKRVLEIGCGMGFDTVELLKRGVRVLATDLTPAAVVAAKRHLAVQGLEAEDIRVANALDLEFPDASFDGVYSIGCLHHTGDMARAVREVHRVLKPGGRAIISHIYRKGSWFRFLGQVGSENIEFVDEDAPVIDYFSEAEVRALFKDFDIIEMTQDHYRALPIARKGPKAWAYRLVFKPLWNLLPVPIAKRFAHKISLVAIKKG